MHTLHVPYMSIIRAMPGSISAKDDHVAQKQKIILCSKHTYFYYKAQWVAWTRDNASVWCTNNKTQAPISRWGLGWEPPGSQWATAAAAAAGPGAVRGALGQGIRPNRNRPPPPPWTWGHPQRNPGTNYPRLEWGHVAVLDKAQTYYTRKRN